MIACVLVVCYLRTWNYFVMMNLQSLYRLSDVIEKFRHIKRNDKFTIAGVFVHANCCDSFIWFIFEIVY